MRFAKHHFPKRKHSHAAARSTRKEFMYLLVRFSHHFLSYSIAQYQGGFVKQYRARAQPAAVADAAARRARWVRSRNWKERDSFRARLVRRS